MGELVTISAQHQGGSRIEVSRVGLGCASAWGQAWFEEKTARTIVRRAIELGVTVFDTGASYSNGNAEPRLGRALVGANVEKLLVSTKVGTHIGNGGKLFHDLSPKMILSSVEASRRRLGLDRIPLLYLHGPHSCDFTEELGETLVGLQEEGWVGLLGVNSFDTQVLEMLVNVPFLNVVMLDYNVLSPSREPLIVKLLQSGKLVVAGAAIANHLYSPKFLWPKSIADLWYSARAFKNYRGDLLRARKLPPLGACPGWTQAQVALAFVLSNPSICTAMFSTTRIKHLEENLAARKLELPENLIERIRLQEF
jgi:aryl-alcohol dehydrogenase-like predicted oxidoreductase